MSKIDINRCREAMTMLRVEGIPNNRERVIADAITAIQSDGSLALLREYMGVKNYAAFGDQREDHPYGYGPKHGSIVFSVRRIDREAGRVLGDDHVYLLECVRDFGFVESEERRHDRLEKVHLNLCDVIDRLTRAESDAAKWKTAIGAVEVETHQPAEARP